jgi:hypothetical protein
MAFLNKIYLRGTISMGDFYILKKESKMLIVGPAINEAAECYELTEWIGISCAPSASLTYSNQGGIFRALSDSNPVLKIKQTEVKLSEFSLGVNCFVRYSIPTKRGIEALGWALAWPIYSIYPYEKFDERFQEEMNHKNFQSKPLGYDVYLKFHNTRIFYEGFRKAIREGRLREIDWYRLTGISKNDIERS